MVKDIEGVERGVVGYSKVADEDGDYLAQVEFILKPIDLDLLRQIFKVDPNDPDPIVRDIIYPLRINLEQSRFLQPYVIDGYIDINKYNLQIYTKRWESL